MFTPRYLKQSKLLLRHAQKFLRYKIRYFWARRRANQLESGDRALHRGDEGATITHQHQERKRRRSTPNCTSSRRSRGNRIGGRISR